MKRKKIKVSLPVIFFREGKYFIARCPILDLAAQGKTYEEAGKRFEYLVDIFFKELEEKGTLEDVLTGLGWKKAGKTWVVPTPIGEERKEVLVPCPA
jgi:predicted RNase H-like HicB family nuclease